MRETEKEDRRRRENERGGGSKREKEGERERREGEGGREGGERARTSTWAFPLFPFSLFLLLLHPFVFSFLSFLIYSVPYHILSENGEVAMTGGCRGGGKEEEEEKEEEWKEEEGGKGEEIPEHRHIVQQENSFTAKEGG